MTAAAKVTSIREEAQPINPGFEHIQVRDKRDAIAERLNIVSGTELKLKDRKAALLKQITEIDVSLENCATERAELTEMDEGYGDYERRLERILRERASQ